MTDHTRPYDLRVDHLVAPLGIGEARPRLSWRTEAEGVGWEQAAYQIRVVDRASGKLLWDSGKVDSPESFVVGYGGPQLGSRRRSEWRVKVWGTNGSESEWSEPAPFEMGLLARSDWTALFITPDWDEDATKSQPCPYLRREFDVPGQVASARLYLTSLGVYQAEINGQRVSDDIFRPGWTSYRRRLCYQTYDVTVLVQPGQNAIGVEARGSGGVGVHGDTFDGIGVRAQCLGAAFPGYPTGPELALDVIGKTRFSTAGSGVVPKKWGAAAVLDSAVTAASHITVTFTGDPDKASVAWVERRPGIGFRVHLSSRPRWEVPFTYLIVEPGSPAS